MKIFVVANNYEEHNKSCGEALYSQESPVVYAKADSALLKDRKPFFLPDWSSEVDAEAHLAVRICRLGKAIPERFAHRYYDALTLGVVFTARDVLRDAIRCGLPWEEATGFDGSAVLGEWVEKEKFLDASHVHFSLCADGAKVAEGCAAQMLHHIDALISRLSRLHTLKTGDLLFTGAPVKAVDVAIGQRLTGFLEDRMTTDFNIK